MRRHIFLLAAVLGLLVFGVGGAGAASTFTDATGDATAGAADVTQVDVANDLDGNITFDLTLANRSALTPDDVLFIFLDSDNSTATGLSGIDYVVAIDAQSASLFRYAPPNFAPAPAPTLSTSNGGRSVRINRNDLGGTSVFAFFVTTGLDSNDNAGDDAPDGNGAYLYTLQLRPALDSLAARFSPAKPRAGKVFRLASTSLRLEDGTDVKADSLTCVARLNGKRLAGRCSWRIPKNARGKLLVVTISARYRGASAAFLPWRFRVAR